MWLRMTLVIVMLVTAGWVVVPYPVFGSSETFIEEETLEFIEIGQSTRAELQQAIGLPDLSFNDGSRWIYKVRMSKPGGWGGCYVEVISYEGSAGCGKSVDEPVMTILDLSISDLGVISKQEISTVEMGKCTQTGVCFRRIGDIEMDVDRKRRNRTSAFVGDTCSIIFLRTGKVDYIGLEVDSLGEQVGRLGSDHYAILDVLPGRHVLTVSAIPFDETVKREYRSIGLDCQKRETIYVHEKDAAADFELMLLVEEVGPPQYIVDRQYSKLSPPYKEQQ